MNNSHTLCVFICIYFVIYSSYLKKGRSMSKSENALTSIDNIEIMESITEKGGVFISSDHLILNIYEGFPKVIFVHIFFYYYLFSIKPKQLIRNF